MANFDYTQGSPRLILDVDGADVEFKGGQPVMDQGLENASFISLFTAPGWWGNDLVTDENKKIGSEFEAVAKQAITITALQRIKNAAERALKWMLDSRLSAAIGVSVSNPNASRINTTITIEPPGRSAAELSVEKNGANWIAQKQYPANERLT